MAKASPLPTKVEKYPYPSHYASHSMMVDKSLSEQLSDNLVVCKDEEGYYITEKKRLDNNLADPNRYGNPAARDLNKWGVGL